MHPIVFMKYNTYKNELIRWETIKSNFNNINTYIIIIHQVA